MLFRGMLLSGFILPVHLHCIPPPAESWSMKTRFLNRTGQLEKTFSSGSVIKSQMNFSQEDVRPGPMLRNDPRFHKTNATWSYRIFNRVALNDYDSGGKDSHTLTSPLGVKTLSAHGCFGEFIPDPTNPELDALSYAPKR